MNDVKKPITVLIFIHYYLPGYESGGPVKSIANIVTTLGTEFDFRIITLGWDLKDKTPYTTVQMDAWNKIGSGMVWYYGGGLLSLWKLLLELRRNKKKVIYLNSLFDPFFTLLPLLAIKLKLINPSRIIVAPRGELSPGALNLKRSKKDLYIRFFNFLNFPKKVNWHASTEMEKSDILENFKKSSNIYTACDLAALPAPAENNLSTNSLVFISRITPKKNLAYALKVLALCHSKLTFNIYGTVEDEIYWNECQLLIKALPDNIQVIFHGQLKPEEVTVHLQKYSLFFFPTLGENYGHVIAEALSAGLPILLSDQTPWNDVEGKNAGWIRTLSSPESFSKVIDDFINMSSEERIELNKRVRLYAHEKLTRLEDIQDNRVLFTGHN